VEDQTTRERLKILISNFIWATKEHLRQGVRKEELRSCDKYSIDEQMKTEHIPNNILKLLFLELNELLRNKTISHEQMLYINEEVRSFSEGLGACERIRRTPIPYSYSIFLKKIIFIYIASMPFGFAMDFGYWSVMIVPLLFYIFGSIELIAEEIEDPFGLDANDLPTDQISQTISKNLDEILN
jgi:putative membrane protein